MPRLDGTGPRGAGPRTGRKQGSCQPKSSIRCGLGWGLAQPLAERPQRAGFSANRSAVSLAQRAVKMLKRMGGE